MNLLIFYKLLKFINLSQADIKKIVFGASIFYSGAPELTPGLNCRVRVSRFLCSVL